MNRLFRYALLGLAVMSICLIVSVAQSQPLTSASLNKSLSNSTTTEILKQHNTVGVAQQARQAYISGQLGAAAKYWQEAAQAFQSQGDNHNQAVALNYLALSYYDLSKYNQATIAILDSLKLLRADKLSEDREQREQIILAQALNIQGQLQLAKGQTEQALISWQQSGDIYTKLGDEVGVVGSLVNQAQAQQTLGLTRRALITLEQVTKDLAAQPDSRLKVASLRSLGNTLRLIGNLEQSRRQLQQGLAIAQKLNLSEEIADTLASLGNTARTQQDNRAALNFYQEAAASTSNHVTQVQAQLNQLSLLVETQQLDAAQVLVPQISTKIAALPPGRAAVFAQINYAQSLRQLRQAAPTASPAWEDIARLLAEAVQQAKSLGDDRATAAALGDLGSVYELTQQQSVAKELTQQALGIAEGINAPDISYRLSWQLGRLLKDTGAATEAIASYSEAVKLLNSLRSDLVGVNQDIQFDFRDRVEPIYRQLVDLLLQPAQPSQQSLITARNTIESLQLAELDNFFRVACLQGKPVQIDQVVDRDDPTAAVIYPIVLPERIEVIVKLPNQPLIHYHSEIAQLRVNQLSEELRRSLTRSYQLQNTRDLSQQLYSWLLRPAERALAKSGVKTLVFVLNSGLRNIPMSALFDGQRYLVEKYAVALTPGLQLLPPQTIEQIRLRALTAGLTAAREGFSALANVGSELEQIESEVSSLVLLNQEFTSNTLSTKLASSPFPIVHLATHGQFSSEMAKTFILAWDKPIMVNDLSNLLSSTDTDPSSAIELLVLSACQTATGDNRAALGLAGIAVRSGARSTIASLWSLDDESSALLMGQFYKDLAGQKHNKAESLRRAQLALLNSERYQDPKYWAAFVLIGNWL